LGTPQTRVEETVTKNTMTYKIRYTYRLVVDNYIPGDDIFLFGFSRGEFAARAMADFIHEKGIFRKATMHYFDLAWDVFTKGRKYDEGDLIYPDSKAVRCIGVWDTVGSLGVLPLLFYHKDDISTARAAHRRHDRFNVSRIPKAKYAFQALALDEARFDFYPAVWMAPSSQHVVDGHFAQTWFPGVNSEIGGEKGGGMSSYPFLWMVSKLQAQDLLLLDDGFIYNAVVAPLKTEGIPPWELVIGGKDYIERISRLITFVPQSFRRFLRTAHRNPYLSTRAIESDSTSIQKAVIGEQTFHGTVGKRMARKNYWTWSKALRKGSVQDATGRERRPVGIDLVVRDYFDNMPS
jgi:hypothetical protein